MLFLKEGQRLQSQTAPTPMQSLSIQHAQPGMRIIHDIKDGNGRILLPADCTLDERKLKALRSWGITEVVVDGAEALRPGKVELPEAQSLQVEAIVCERFRHNDPADPAVEEMKRLVFNRVAKQLGYLHGTAQR